MPDPPEEPNAHSLAKATAEAVAPEVSKYIGTILGASQIEAGEMAAEWIRYHRFKRSIKYLKKSMKQLEDAGLHPQEVPVKTLVPLMENASLEDDEELSDRWASLLANAAAGGDVPPSFTRILSDLEPVHARVLDELYNVSMSMAPGHRDQAGISGPKTAEAHGMDREQFGAVVDNLFRLRVAQGVSEIERWDSALVATPLGRRFVRACRPPGQPDPPIRWQTHQDFKAYCARTRGTSLQPQDPSVATPQPTAVEPGPLEPRG